MTTTDTIHPITIDGTPFGYTESDGGGAPLLLVHAGVFADWFAPLAREPELTAFRVIRIVRAGYGDDSAPTGAVSIGDHAAHCAALLDALETGPAHVVGHSSGAAIAMQLAQDRPDLVRSLVLAEPPLVDSLVDPEDLSALHEAVGPVIGAALAATARGDLGTAYDTFMDAICGVDHREAVAGALGQDGLIRAEAESAFFFRDEMGAVAGWTPDLVALGGVVSTLLVVGSESPPFTHRLAVHLASMVPRARIATLAGADHLMPLRDPGGLAAIVAASIEEADRVRST